MSVKEYFVVLLAMGDLASDRPRLVALGIFGALTKLKSAASDLPYTSQVALGLFGQCNAQASEVARSENKAMHCSSWHARIFSSALDCDCSAKQ